MWKGAWGLTVVLCCVAVVAADVQAKTLNNKFAIATESGPFPTMSLALDFSTPSSIFVLTEGTDNTRVELSITIRLETSDSPGPFVLDVTSRDLSLTILNGAAGVNADVLDIRTIPAPLAFPALGSNAERQSAIDNNGVSFVNFGYVTSSVSGGEINEGDTFEQVLDAWANGDMPNPLSGWIILDLDDGLGSPIERRYSLSLESVEIIPEPASVAMLGLAGVVVPVRRRR